MQPVTTFLSSSTGTSEEFDWVGGRGIFQATAAAWNAGNVKLQWKGADDSWNDLNTDCVLTANGGGVFHCNHRRKLRVVAALPTGVTAEVEPF